MLFTAGSCVTVNDYALVVGKLIGHGKGGYSYLADHNGQQVLLKQIHHEPRARGSSDNTLEAEERDYLRLVQAGIRVPAMLAIDRERELIVKEYIAGCTLLEIIAAGQATEPYFRPMRDMAAQAEAAGLNIDYFPGNFVVCGGLLYYIDYECNAYTDEWSFANWGMKFWARTPEFEECLRQKLLQTQAHLQALTERL
ncbi:hypothetical protein IJT17_02830 [bacterium]|nr:hypothetical protein [bacterium]